MLESPRYTLLVFSTAGSLLLLGLFSLIFSASPMTGEDYGLGLMDNGQTLSTRLFWFIDHASHQWYFWNARLGEMSSIFFLSLPKAAFDVAAVLAFAIYCALIAVVSLRVSTFNRAFLIGWVLAASLSFILFPRYEVFFWR